MVMPNSKIPHFIKKLFMPYLEQVNLHEWMLQLIKMRATGGPENFAKRVRIGRSSLYRHIDILKAQGHNIRYNSARESFELF
jgi:hypothetical protein